VKIQGNGSQIRPKKGQGRERFFDVSSALIANSSGSLLKLTSVPQGVGVNQRTGDTIIYKRFYMNYTLATNNSDLFNTSRIIIFQWHPNDALLVPLVTDVLQTANLYSMYNFQFSNQYTIIFDHVYFMSGLTTAPTVSGNIGFFGSVSLRPCKLQVEFAPAATTSSNALYLLDISDSALAPFPSGNVVTRIIFIEN